MARFRERSDPLRPTFLFGLLVATLLLTLILAYQAQDAARSHRATAERVLQDYANLAAQEMVRRAGQHLGYYKLYPMLQPVLRQGWDDELPEVPGAQGGTEPPAWFRSYFRLVLPQGSVRVRGAHNQAIFDSETVSWLAEDAQSFDPDWGYSLFPTAGEETTALVYRIRELASGEKGLEGLIVDLEGFGPIFQDALDRSSLLPPSLQAGRVDNSLLSVAISDTRGRTIFRTRTAYDTDITANASLAGGLSALSVSVTLKPEAAQQLVIGGLPATRMPLLIGLFVLTTGLIAAAFRQLRRERELSRRQADFIAAVSHELRTPLAQIQMFGETLLLRRVRSAAEEKRALEIICQETQRLANLVENVIQFSRSLGRSDRRPPGQARPFDPVPLLEEIRERFAPLAQSLEATLDLQVDRGARLRVDADSLRRVLLNLLDNAVKYGPNGQTVILGFESGPERARFWVEDQGEGIEEAERTLIWKRFERLPRHRNTSAVGTGIGLAVVRELTESMGGKVWVETGERGGARFVVELPAQPPEAVESTSRERAPESASGGEAEGSA